MITVYITTLNRPELLSRALESLCDQTYKDFEVIICNDFSDEIYNNDYNNVIEKYRGKLRSLIYVENKSRKGACFSRNRAINLAKGEYITGLDDDDIFDSVRLELFITSIIEIDCSFVCSNIKKIASRGESRKEFSRQGEFINLEQMKNMNLVGNQIFIKTEKLRELNGFDINMPAWQDYDMWYRTIEKFGPCFKLYACTMYLDDDDSRERITTGSKAYHGYKMFIEKHNRSLSESNLLSLKYADLLNRKQKISIFDKIVFKDFKLYIKVMKYQMTYKFKSLYDLYQLYLK